MFYAPSCNPNDTLCTRLCDSDYEVTHLKNKTAEKKKSRKKEGLILSLLMFPFATMTWGSAGTPIIGPYAILPVTFGDPV